MSDLPKRLRIKAGMIALGERIAWGSDTAIMEEAADMIEALSAAAPATPAAQVAVPEAWWQLIHDTLRNYRMSTLVDEDGEGYPLIDAMTADSQPVSGGIEECTYLADAIWNALLAAAPTVKAEQVQCLTCNDTAMIGDLPIECPDCCLYEATAPANPAERQERGEVQRLRLVEMIDAAMVEMQNISPPLRRSECERLIRAALSASTGQEVK